MYIVYMYEYLCYVEKKNSYWKNSCNLLVFVLLNGVLIKKNIIEK